MDRGDGAVASLTGYTIGPVPVPIGEDFPALCRQACDGEAQCRAWTYVKPGVQGASARRWLKNGVPAAKVDSCCTSGVK